MRNPEIGVGHLEKWAEMLNILKDISGNRMPSVADLLKQASQAPKTASNSESPSNKSPKAGETRASAAGQPTEPDPNAKKQPPTKVPSVNDVESTHGFAKKDDKNGSAEAPSKSGKPSLGLATTTLIGPPKKGDDKCPADQKVEEAVKEQQDLLAEFEKLTDELNKVLANLEGSTLVKRLKAGSLACSTKSEAASAIRSAMRLACLRMRPRNRRRSSSRNWWLRKRRAANRSPTSWMTCRRTSSGVG